MVKKRSKRNTRPWRALEQCTLFRRLCFVMYSLAPVDMVWSFGSFFNSATKWITICLPDILYGYRHTNASNHRPFRTFVHLLFSSKTSIGIRPTMPRNLWSRRECLRCKAQLYIQRENLLWHLVENAKHANWFRCPIGSGKCSWNRLESTVLPKTINTPKAFQLEIAEFRLFDGNTFCPTTTLTKKTPSIYLKACHICGILAKCSAYSVFISVSHHIYFELRWFNRGAQRHWFEIFAYIEQCTERIAL